MFAFDGDFMQTTIEIFAAVTTILSSFYLILIYVD
jgi:hypothetical protein